MKVVSARQMAAMEKEAYRDGASDQEFMEEAGKGVAHLVHNCAEKHDLQRHVVLLCGKGNNAGDAYVAGRYLIEMGYSVFALQLVPLSACSELCKINSERFLRKGGPIHEIESVEEMALPMRGIILDGIFGTGFKGTVEEPIASIIAGANASGLPIIAIDVPSGLNGDTGEVEGEAIKATFTSFLGLPKTGFFLGDGWDYVGELYYVDFGLAYPHIEATPFDFEMLTADMMRALMPPIKRTRHKYEAGYVVGLAGSSGMGGAAILSSWAALKGGAGYVRLLHPENMVELAPYEIVKTAVDYTQLAEILAWMDKASALFLGPGLGRTDAVKRLLKQLIPQLKKPVVVDADALTLIGELDISIPQQAILTPHKQEMARLLQLETLPSNFIEVCQNFVEEKKITLVLKGAPTFIFHPGEKPFVNTTGDPGMATAGSGDVLTGLIAAILSQGVQPLEAAQLAVFLHGVAGEAAAEDETSYCMIASNIIEHFPHAFSLLDPSY